MALLSTQIIEQYLLSQDLHVTKLEDFLLRTGFNFNGGSMEIFLAIEEDDAHLHLEGREFIKVPEDKYDVMYKIINEANDNYKNVKFVLNEDGGQINARDDEIIQLDTCGPEAYELLIRMVAIVEDAYPKFMKAIWS